MNPTLAITIDSSNYLEIDRALRVKTADYHPNPPAYVAEIIRARRMLGLPCERQYVLSDYVEEPLFPIESTQKTEP